MAPGYTDAIAAHDDRFDETWMTRTFEDYYRGFGNACNLVTRMLIDKAASGPVNETLITESVSPYVVRCLERQGIVYWRAEVEGRLEDFFHRCPAEETR